MALDTIAPKPWWQSRGVVGSAITIVATIAGLLGYAISPEDISTFTEQVFLAVAAVGGILSMVGRIFAKRQIK